MTRSHVIEQTLIEVNFKSEEEAFEHQAVLASSVKTRLLSVMDEVFTELSPTEHILRIDHLEVDLGVVAPEGFAEEMARRLKERLGDALREHLQRIEPLHGVELISPARAELESLEHFLMTGSLPWQATLKSGWAIDDLLQRVIASHGPQFLTFLRGAIGRGNVLRRLAGQFSETVLIDLVRLLEPGVDGFIAEAIKSLDLDRSDSGGSPDGSSRRRGWKFTLTYLLAKQERHFDPTAYLESLIRQEAAHARSSAPDLLQAMTSERDEGADARTSSRELHTVLNELAAAWGLHQPVSAEGTAASATLLRAYDWAETLRIWLRRGVAPEGGEPLSALLDRLVRDAPWLLVQLARDLQARESGEWSDTAHLPNDVWQSFWTTMLARWPVVDPAAWRRVLDRSVEQGRVDLRRYGTWLEQLVRGQALTEESPLGEPAAVPQAGALPEARPVLRESSRLPLAAERAGLETPLSEAECLALLQMPHPLTEADFSRLIVMLDHVSAASANRLRRSVAALMADRAAVDQLITDLPDRLLTRLVALVRPAEHAEAQRVVGLLSLAGLGVEGLVWAELRRAAWQVLFYDLIAEGRPVRLDTVVGRFLARLTEQGQRASSHELHTVLNELVAAWGLHQPVLAEGTAESAALVQAYDRAETIRTWLLWGVAPVGGEPLPVLLDRLVRDAPWMLVQLARDLQARESGESSDTAHLPNDVWQSFWATLLARWPGIDRMAWQRVLDRAAGEERAHPAWYGRLLEQLVWGQAPTDEAHRRDAPAAAPHIGEPVRPEAPLSEAECLALLQAPHPLSEADFSRLLATVEQGSAATADWLRPQIPAWCADRAAVDQLITGLPDRLLTRLVALVRPAEHAEAQRAVGLLSLASLGVEGLAWAELRRAAWQVLFYDLIAEGRPVRLDTVVDRFLARLAEQGVEPDPVLLRARLRLNLMQRIVPTNPIDGQLVAVLSRTDERGRDSAASRRWELTNGGEDEPDYTEQVYITNAGQVLASAYLPRLFSMLNLIERDAFRTPAAAMRAVHVLQFMVNESVDSPEYQLVLNKILCGVKPGVPIERSIVIMADERRAVEGMLHAMVRHWKIIGNTSIAGLRESFLQREGRLRLQGDAWHLLVEPRPFDMLLDQIPWSFTTIKYPWMERVLHVEWR